MLRYIPAMAAAIAMPVVPTAPALAQSTQGAACSKLSSSWDMLEKNLADAAVNGPKDRNMDDLTGLTAGNLLYTMMKDNSCALPTTPPMASTYYASAMKCRSERTEGVQPKSCDRETWSKAAG